MAEFRSSAKRFILFPTVSQGLVNVMERERVCIRKKSFRTEFEPSALLHLLENIFVDVNRVFNHVGC